MSTPDQPPAFVLVLRPVADPIAGHGLPPRSAEYRLKLVLKHALRAAGLRCIRCTPLNPVPTGQTAPLAEMSTKEIVRGIGVLKREETPHDA